MTKPRLSLYTHEREILDYALANGGAVATFPTHGQAVYFRQRCYEFRKKFAATESDSKYDTLTLPALPSDGLEVTVLIREAKHISLRPVVSTITVADDEDLAEIELEVKNEL